MVDLAYQNTVLPRVSQFESVAETATRQDPLKKRMSANLSWKRRYVGKSGAERPRQNERRDEAASNIDKVCDKRLRISNQYRMAQAETRIGWLQS